ncbi:MAG: amidohydrolase family protein [Actinobacteria bacterium]|nr:amidohydrolase family protein [Actinomycetota bacterium]MBL7123888.1 amidohydrolase family protein [Actinomycetota bacterium]
MIIDTETHLITRLDYLGKIDLEYSPELLIAEMDNAGVDKAVIIGYEMKDVKWVMELGGKDVRYRRIINKEYYINAYKKYPNRFIWFTYGFDPNNKNYLDIVKEDVSIGAGGIKLLPAVTGFTMDDKRLIPLFKYCERQKLPVLLGNEYWNYLERPPHTDDFFKYCTPIHKIMDEYEINWLLTHLGCANHTNEYPHPYGKVKKDEIFKNLEELNRLMSHPNVWMENAYTVAYFRDEEYPYPTLQKLLKRYINEIGIDKFVFATDWPYTENFCKYKQQIELIRNADYLSDKEKEKFLSKNVEKYLNF